MTSSPLTTRQSDIGGKFDESFLNSRANTFFSKFVPNALSNAASDISSASTKAFTFASSRPSLSIFARSSISSSAGSNRARSWPSASTPRPATVGPSCQTSESGHSAVRKRIDAGWPDIGGIVIDGALRRHEPMVPGPGDPPRPRHSCCLSLAHLLDRHPTLKRQLSNSVAKECCFPGQ